MLTSLIFCLWTISCHLSLSLLTPTTLIALAHIQANKARAVAHALQARAKYRNVFHKPGFGLGDARLVRKPRQLIPIDENLVEPDYTNEDIDFDINDNGIDFSPNILQEDGDELDEGVGMARESDYQQGPEAPDIVCMVNEHAPDGNPLLIPIMYRADQVNSRHTIDEGVPQRPPDSPPSNSRDANPHFFKHGFAHKYSKTISHELVPSQADVHNQIVINPHSHTTQLVNPPVHVNVMQNQNSAVVPQQTIVQPAYTNAPVLPTTIVNHVPVTQHAQQFVNTGSQVHSHGGGCPHCQAGLAHAHSGFGHAGTVHSGFGHSTSVSQGQSIQTHNSGWPQNHINIAQNQNIHTRRGAEDDERERHENLSSPYFDKEPEMILQAVRIPPEMTPSGGDDAKLGTFLVDESNGNFDQGQSQNRQSVNNIEDEQKNFNMLLPTSPVPEEHNDGSHPEMRMKMESSEEDDKGYMNAYGGGQYYESSEEEDPMKKFLDKENKKIAKKILKMNKKMEKLLHKSDKKKHKSNKKKQYNVYNYNHYDYSNDKHDYGKYGYSHDDYDKYASHDMKDKYHKKGYDKYGNKKPTNMYTYEANSLEVPDNLPSYTMYQDNTPHNSYNNPYPNYDKNTYYYRQAHETEESANTAKFTENDSIMHKEHEILPENHPLLGQPMEINQNQQIENNNTEQEEGVRSLPDPLLGYIVRIPERQDYRRTARSINKNTDHDLGKIILAEKEMINTIKKHANRDKDLMMISYIGDSFIKDWEKKYDKNRTRRDIGRDSYSLKKLFTDPATKLDVPKTLENLGAVTKQTFEHESTPLYHVRQIVGSAKDAVMAAMKIPNQNIITPSQYSIVNPQDERISSISPKIFSRNDDLVDNQITSTFEKVGSVLRDSVKSGQDVLNHIGDMANHGKDAIYSFQYVTPRVMLNRLPPILKRPIDKTVIISPRIMDVYDDRERVGSNRGDTNPDFVKLGHVFDAIGLSRPNSELTFQKITLQPKYAIPNTAVPILQSRFTDVRVEDINKDQDHIVRETLDNFRDATESLGAKDLKDFFDIIRNKTRDVLKKQVDKLFEIPRIQIVTPNHYANMELDNRIIKDRPTRSLTNATNPVEDPETVGAGLFPDVLLHPFMNHYVIPEKEEKLNSSNNTKSEKSHDTNHYRDDIVGSINPLIFERMFNETVPIKNDTSGLHGLFHVNNNETSQNSGEERNDEVVSTSMTMEGPMLEPFLGKISAETFEEVFHNYQSPPGYDGHPDGDKY